MYTQTVESSTAGGDNKNVKNDEKYQLHPSTVLILSTIIVGRMREK